MCVYVSLCGVYLPLVVFSARVERSGLSMLTLSHSTSKMHILPDRERQRKRRCEGRGAKVEKVNELLEYLSFFVSHKNTHNHTPFK